jgi:SET and MYND domain-containing protein
MQEQLPPSAIEVALRQVLQVTMEILTRRAHGKIPDQQWKVLCDLPTHSNEFSRSEFEVPMVEILGAYHRFNELRSYSLDSVFEMYTRVPLLISTAGLIIH